MATYASYRHVELDRIGLGKKRVNCSPGGGGPLSNPTREPRTVRVLKPPGGGSSICFGDYPELEKKNVVSNKPEQIAPKEPAPSAEKETPKETSTVDSPAAESSLTNEPTSHAEKTNAQVESTKTNGTTFNAGQRGRVPPGGFSSKLW